MTAFLIRKFALVAVLAVAPAFAPMAVAQATRPAAEPAVDLPVLQRLQDRIGGLDLTDEQKKQVSSLKDEIAETVRGMAPELKNASPAERREKVRAAVGDVRGKLMSILTPEQQAKLKDGVTEQRLPGRRPLADLKGKKEADAPMVARLREAVDGLGLSTEQKTQTDAILDDTAAQAKQIRQDAAGDRDAAREKAMELARSTRAKLAAVLTAEQKQKLADALPGPGREGGREANRPGRRFGGPATRPVSDATSGDTNAIPASAPATAGPAASQSADAAAASRSVTATAVVVPVVGQPAPSFNLVRLNGSAVANKTFTSRPVVLVFGSLSSPSFRDRVPKLTALKNRYRGRADVLVVYTREAHPDGVGRAVERNKDDKISVPVTKTVQERIDLAAKLRDLTKTDLDFLIDGPDDATLHAFGDRPDGAVVVSRFGTLIGTQTFCDPSGLPRLIDEAIKEKGTN